MNNKIRAYRSLLIGVLLAVSLGAAGPSLAHEKGLLVLDVKPDGGTFTMVDDGNSGGPFFISGLIFAPGTVVDPIGKFLCWGYFGEEGAVAVVSQEFDLDGRGKIQVQGVEDEGLRAVTGGTGDFRNVRGEADVVMTGPLNFTSSFRLIGVEDDDDDSDSDSD